MFIHPRVEARYIALLFSLILLLSLLLILELIGHAFRKIGFSPFYSVFFLFLSLLGSYVNIPISEVTSREPIVSNRVIDFYWFKYIIPTIEVERRTIIAINLGGAVVPIAISLFLATKLSLIEVLLGVSIMSLLIHLIARPVKGLGIAIPPLIPPILAAALGVLIAPSNAPLLAYISGTLGCLIGADLLNLKKIPYLGARMASIGGAGTFDGIFLTGVIAVLLT
ncbi:MAG: DUF1614 domain-containing protein [Methanocellales archaeon]